MYQFFRVISTLTYRMCISSSTYCIHIRIGIKYSAYQVLCVRTSSAYQLLRIPSTYQRLCSSAYQPFRISAPCINSSTYQVLCLLCAYRLFCVSASPYTVYVSASTLLYISALPPSPYTVYVSASTLLYISALPRISSLYQLFHVPSPLCTVCIPAPLRISSSA